MENFEGMEIFSFGSGNLRRSVFDQLNIVKAKKHYVNIKNWLKSKLA